MRTYALILSIAMQGGAAQAPSHPPVPIFIELFASEGCSSCPPADAWLEKVDASQPIPGAEVIVESEHVDYWNHDGWKDPYSSSALTARQSIYAREFGLGSPYTPQAIADGQTELHLNDPRQSIEVFQMSASASMIPLTIGRVSWTEAVRLWSARISRSRDIQKSRRRCLWCGRTGPRRISGPAWQNGGKHLTQVAVVEEIKKIGNLEKGRDVSLDLQTKLPSGVDPRNLRLVVFLQQSGQGKVLGAAMSRPES